MVRVVLPADERNGGTTTTIDLSGFSGSIEADLERRDFTVNAMGVPLTDWTGEEWAAQVMDPLGGKRDLMQKTIRALNPRVFEDDPARLLRGGTACG